MLLTKLKYPRQNLKLIDLLVLVLVLVGLSFFLRSYSRQKTTFYLTLDSKTQEYTAIPIPPPYWIGNSIKVGDVSFDSTGNRVAEVAKVENLPAGGMRQYLKVTFKVEGLTDQLNRQYRINDIPLEIGRELTLTIGNTNFEGLITYVGETLTDPNYTPQKLTLNLLGRSLDPTLIATLSQNLPLYATSSSEIVVNQISVKPAEKSIANAAGDLIKSLDPIYKDLELNVTIPVNCHLEDCYYHEVYPIKVGNKIDFYTNNFSLPEMLINDVSKEAKLLEP